MSKTATWRPSQTNAEGVGAVRVSDVALADGGDGSPSFDAPRVHPARSTTAIHARKTLILAWTCELWIRCKNRNWNRSRRDRFAFARLRATPASAPGWP